MNAGTRTKKAPVILLAFSDERDGRRLTSLQNERRSLEAALEPLQDEGLCEIVVEPTATIDDITRRLDQFGDRLAIFHFAGHASPDAIQMESADGGTTNIDATGFAGLLSARGRRPPSLVFINGCSSAEQSIELLNQGVLAVVGTLDSVDDDVATGFAGLFYQQIAGSRSIAEAFDFAESRYASEFGKETQRAYRQVEFEDGDPPSNEWPWKLYPEGDKGKRAREWSIAGLKSTAEEARNTRLLGYMCDRRDQVDFLIDKLLPEQELESSSRPVGLIVHGPTGEAHRKFLKRLEVWDLPHYLSSKSGVQPLVQHVELEWKNSAESLQRQFAEQLTGRGDASPDEVLAAYADTRSPMIVSAMIDIDDWSKSTPKAIEGWFSYIATLGELPKGQAMLVVVAVREEPSSQWDQAKIWKATPARFVKKFNAPKDMTAAALPRLEPIPKRIVTDQWLDRKEEFEAQVKELLDELPAARREGVILEIHAYVDKLYKEEESDVLQMRVLGANLALKIHNVIEEAR
ncbi:MAG: CHAT domain-containing protein [Woeseiaceae bacterium]|nr:CHAT domain-containing protein [Woeseiaceae bacterium]